MTDPFAPSLIRSLHWWWLFKQFARRDVDRYLAMATPGREEEAPSFRARAAAWFATPTP